ncbi:MAG: FAD-dependent oxidoreductase [Hyphomicrobiaceae bacterium]
MEGLSIAIAGAGTGGLAAACFLARAGHRVEIFERFAEPRPLGAGLMLQPTGLACLARLGLDQEAIASGRVLSGIHGRTLAGTVIFDISYDVLGSRCFGVGIHRGTLFNLLLDAVTRAQIPVRTGCDIRTTTCADDGRRLIDGNGRTHGPFNLVVDATGMRSVLRAGEVTVRVNRPNPYGAVWGIVDEPADWPYKNQLRQRYDGCHTMVGVLPVGHRPSHEKPVCAVFWSLRVGDYPLWRSAGIPAWRDRVLKIWPETEPMLSQFASVDDLTQAVYADITLARPTSDRMVLIGDAARTASPQLGQGANLALVDAMTLADCLAAEPALAPALDRYARQRRAHTRFYTLASQWLTPFFQSDSRIAGVARDAVFPPMAHVPWLRRQMVETLAGIKTGPFSRLDPGKWDERYGLGRTPPAEPAPANTSA